MIQRTKNYTRMFRRNAFLIIFNEICMQRKLISVTINKIETIKIELWNRRSRLVEKVSSYNEIRYHLKEKQCPKLENIDPI